MSEAVIYPQLPKNKRMIVISDIHANLPYFWGLLDKLDFSGEDVLIIDGDFLEKGRQSLETLRYIMELAKRESVYVLRGNCDGWHQILYWGERMSRYTLRYMLARENCLLRQMCREGGLDFSESTSIEELRGFLRGSFARELEFLASLPIIMDTKHYTFVHGGVSAPSVAEADPLKCMKNDNFLGQGLSFDKWQIVGHWPVVLYHEHITNANPIILPERKIASIDGGCVLKDDGQLNALIIPFDGSEDFKCVYYDPFPLATALEAQSPSERSYYIRWGDNQVEILKRGEEFSRCRHIRTGYEMDVLTDFLREGGEGVTVNDCSDYLLPVSAGDTLSIVRKTSRGCLCKKNGVSGWYKGALVPLRR